MISSKVSNGTLGGLAAAGVTAALVYYVPAFKSGLPGPVSDLVTAAVGAIGYFAAGYQSTHRATVPEVQAAIADAHAVLDAEQTHRQPRPAPPGGHPVKGVDFAFNPQRRISGAEVRRGRVRRPVRLTPGRERHQRQKHSPQRSERPPVRRAVGHLVRGVLRRPHGRRPRRGDRRRAALHDRRPKPSACHHPRLPLLRRRLGRHPRPADRHQRLPRRRRLYHRPCPLRHLRRLLPRQDEHSTPGRRCGRCRRSPGPAASGTAASTSGSS